MKRLTVIISLLVLCLVMNGFTASARVRFGEPTVSTDGAQTIITYPVVEAEAGKSALLVATYIDIETGKLLSVGTTTVDDASLVSSIEVTLADKSADGGILQYYLLDDKNNVTPIGNFAPLAPTAGGLEIKTDDTYSHWKNAAVIDWTEATDDDYDSPADFKYNLYDDGKLIEENMTGTSSTVKNLIPGTEYHLGVATKDTDGAVSKEDTFDSFKVEMPNTVVTTDPSDIWSDHMFVDAQVGHNVIFAGVADDGAQMTRGVVNHIGGMPCFVARQFDRNPDGTWQYNNPGFVTYRFSDSALEVYEGQGIKDFTYEFVYFDNSPVHGTIDLWNSVHCGLNSTKEIEMTGGNVWKVGRGTFSLGNTPFSNVREQIGDIGLNLFHFRFKHSAASVTGDGKEVNAYSFTCMPTSEFEEYARLRGADLTIIAETETEDGITTVTDAATVICGLESNAAGLSKEIGKIYDVAGRSAIKTDDLSNGILTFKVNDTNILGNAGEIVVACYSETETTVTIGDSSQILPANKWCKLTFAQDTVGSDTYSVRTSNPVYVSTVRITAQ